MGENKAFLERSNDRLHDFGREGGTEVAEKELILSKIDNILGRNRPPAIEYIYVEPCRLKVTDSFAKKLSSYAYNWGHGALRYTLPNGEQYLLNILNPVSQKPLVCWTTPTDYFFSTSSDAFSKSEQFGIYMRSYISVRIEEIPDENLIAMHEYFQQVLKRFQQNEIEYAKTPFHSVFQGLAYNYGFVDKEPGNCSEWIARGLVVAKVLERPRMCPKQICIDLMLQHQDLHNKGLMHIVSMRRAKHGVMHPTYEGWDVDGDGDSHTLTGQTNWLGWLSSKRHRHLEKFADVVLEVPQGDINVVITKKKPEKHKPDGLYGFLLKSEIESWAIPLFIFVVLFTSPLLFLGLLVGLVLSLRTSGNYYLFDFLCVFVTLLPFLLGTFLISIFDGIEQQLLDAAIIASATFLWRRLLYKFV